MAIVELLAFIAMRGLTQSRITTVLLVLAVAAGVGLQIPNTANLLGYSRSMLEQATTTGFGDVRVQHPSEPLIDDGDALAREVRLAPGIREATPILTFPASIALRGRHQITEVHGVDAGTSFKPYRILAGEDLASTDDDGVLVGSSVADRLSIKPGDRVKVRVLLPPPKDAEPDDDALERDENTPAAPTREEYSMTVRGTVAGAFGACVSLFVRRSVLLPGLMRPHAATRVIAYAGSKLDGTGLSSAARDAPRDTERLAEAVRARAGGLLVTTWMTDHPYANSALQANEVLGVISHTMVVLAVTIPVAALLFVTVQTRRKEIATLSALGLARQEIFAAFVLQATVIAIAGSLVGLGLGGATLVWFRRHPIFDSPDFVIRPVSSAPGLYEPALVVLIATVVAAAIPAWRATRTDPARVLRGAQ